MKPTHIPYQTQLAISDTMAIRSVIAHIDMCGLDYLKVLKELMLDDRRSFDAHVEEDLRAMEILTTIIWACNHALDESKGDE